MTASPVLVLAAFHVTADQARDLPDLIESVRARLSQEAGYLLDGEPVEPVDGTVYVATTSATEHLTDATLLGAFEVGADGIEP